MPKIKVNDVNLYYEEYGQGEPIIFICGFNGNHLMWNSILNACSKNHRVIVFDNRGIGQSDAPDYPYTVEMMADDTAALCKALNISQAHFVGNSMGGMIVQNLAYKYPKLTKSAVISNSVAKYVGIGFKLLLEGQLELIESKASVSTITKVGLHCCFSDSFLSQPGIIDLILKTATENKYPMNAIGFKSQMHACITFDASTWIHKIICPCLVIGSLGDKIFPENKEHKISKIIPNAQYFCFDDTVGHVPCIEQPEIFSKVILDFIAKL